MVDDFKERSNDMKRLIKAGYEGGILTIIRPKDNIKTDKELKNWALQNNLKGLGKEDNPYLIEGTNDLPEQFYVSRVKSWVKVRNRKFDALNLRKCKNFGLENCVFKRLTLINCKNFKIDSCGIQILNLKSAKNNIFTYSSIDNLFNDYSSANIFRSCTISSDAKSNINKNIADSLGLSKLFLLASLMGIISIFSLLLISDLPLMVKVILIIPLLFFVIAITLFYYKKKKARGSPI